jgi:Flp pilus assembly protein TadG
MSPSNPQSQKIHRCHEKGGTLVEFALVFILLMTLIFGLFGFGHALYVYHFLDYTAREATRFASVHGSTCNDDLSCSTTGGPATSTNSVIENYITNIIPPGVDPKKLTITPTYPLVAGGPSTCGSPENAPGCTVKVQLTYPFTFNLPLLPKGTISMSSSSELVIAH